LIEKVSTQRQVRPSTKSTTQMALSSATHTPTARAVSSLSRTADLHARRSECPVPALSVKMCMLQHWSQKALSRPRWAAPQMAWQASAQPSHETHSFYKRSPICTRPSSVRSSIVARSLKSTSKSSAAKSGALWPVKNLLACLWI
jgi:hypothetical protein